MRGHQSDTTLNRVLALIRKHISTEPTQHNFDLHEAIELLVKFGTLRGYLAKDKVQVDPVNAGDIVIVTPPRNGRTCPLEFTATVVKVDGDIIHVQEFGSPTVERFTAERVTLA